MKITGFVLLAVAAVLGLGLWLFPFTAGNAWTGEATCTPIVDVIAHASPGSLSESQIQAAELCYQGSISRVLLGFVGGVVLGVTGVVLIAAGWNTPRPQQLPYYPPGGAPPNYPPPPPHG